MEFNTALSRVVKERQQKKCTYSSYFYCLCDDFVTSFIAHTRTLSVQIGNPMHVWCINARIAKVTNLRKWREKKRFKKPENVLGFEGNFFPVMDLRTQTFIYICQSGNGCLLSNKERLQRTKRHKTRKKSRKCKEE